MDLTREMRIRYFHEYVFARAFNELNAVRESTGSPAFDQETGQRMHDEIVNRLQPETKDLGYAKAGEFARVVNEVIGGPFVNQSTYNSYASDFARFTGFFLKNYEQVHGATVPYQDEKRVPVSSFDNVLKPQYPEGEHANEILYVDVDQVQANDLSSFDFKYLDGDNFVSARPIIEQPAVEQTTSEPQVSQEADMPGGLSREERMTYFNEYMFARTFRRMNEERKRTNQPLIMVSEGRVMHQRLIDALNADGVIDSPDSIGAASPSRFVARMNELFGEEYGLNRNLYNLYAEEFAQYTGIPLKNKDNIEFRSDPKLPVSPFDKKFENRATFRNLGSEMGYVDLDAAHSDFGEDIIVYRERRGDMNPAGEALVEDDKTGLTRLQNFMTQAEYERAKSWVSNLPEDDRISDKGIERAVAILEHLQATGVEFTIEPDDNPGQLKAKLKHENMDIRIMERHSAEGFIGRVYSGGTNIRYSVNMNERNGYKVQGDSRDRSTYKARAHTDATIQETLDLIDYSMGRVVPRRDGSNLNVGETNTRRVSGRILNDAYLSTSGMFSAIATKTEEGNPVVLRVEPYAVENLSRAITTPAGARAKLGESILNARESFAESIDLENLIQAAEAGEEPVFSGDDGIAAMQNVYWEILNGNAGTLLKPGMQRDEFDDVVESNGETYSGTPAEIVRQHLNDSMDYYVGSVNATVISHGVDDTGVENRETVYSDFSFDPVMVAKFMQNGGSAYTNDTSLAEWFRMSELSPDCLKGESFYNKLFQDKIIRFDPESAVQMSRIDDPVAQAALQAIKETLSTTGITVEDKDIMMDGQGIVHYKGRRAYGEAIPNLNRMTAEKRQERENRETFEGEIGQIFLPESNGLVKTNFNGSDNYYFAPGYRAYVVPQKPGEHLSLEDRTRLQGYEQVLCDTIRRTVRQDAMSRAKNIGSVSSLNNVYHQLYDTRFSLDYLEKAQQEQMSQDLLDATIETVSRRVRYSSEIRDGSTINADYEDRKRGDNVIMDNDNYRDPYLLTGKRNMAIMTTDGDGYFDASATGTAYNQGVTRFLTKDAEVTPDGRLVRGSTDGQTPLMMHEACRYMAYNPFDRRQMTFGNLVRAACVTQGVKTAQMTFGGWTFDDGYVVSKDFADKYRILGSDGNMRSLVKGDKISDMNGNKGVISLVVDPNMDPDEAKRQGLEKPVAWFKANPELEVVGAPFAAPSRFNAGSARELMEKPEMLHGPNGEEFDGCIGTTHYIITHMSVDEKTHVYGEEELAQGKGRKASAQLAWAFASQNANDVLRECYGTNNGSYQNLREMMITMGLDMDEVGNMSVGYTPHNGETRKVFEIPEVKVEQVVNASGKTSMRNNISAIKNQFLSDINKSGGMLEMPFPLKMPSGEMTMKLSDVPGMSERPTAAMQDGKETYMLPILSSHLRTGQELDDGSTVNHDYTRYYMNIMDQACKWQLAKEAGNEHDMANIEKNCQAEFDKITGELSRRVFSGKHNYFRDHIMSNRLPNSATAVWTADPRLDIDEVAMGPAMAESIGVKEGDYVLCWRDPMLRDAGVRYNKVHIDESLIGVAINPVMDKSYDGDFDGDSIAIVKLNTPRAQADARAKLSVAANLLDYGSVDEKGRHPVMMQDGLDLKSAQWARPELKEHWDELIDYANDLDPTVKNILDDRAACVADLNDYVHDALDNEYGTDMISFKDMKSHMASIEHMVIDGAKGSYSKLEDYAKYMGIEYKMKDVTEEDKVRLLNGLDGEGRVIGDKCIDLDSIIDHGEPFKEDPVKQRQADNDVQYATAVKSFGTGIAGMFSQRGMSVLRNHCPKAVLELTYPVTQAVLQAKHDPIDAAHKYDVLKSSARKLWQGHLLERVDGPNNSVTWKDVYGPDNKPLQATPEQFEKQFLDMYTSSGGLNVKINPDYVKEITKVLTDPETGLIMDLESTAKDKLASPMDKMAYGGTFDTVKEMAEKNVNLFEGRYNQMFQPYVVSANVRAIEKGLDPKAIVKSDIKLGYDRKNKSKMAVAVGVGVTQNTEQPKMGDELAAAFNNNLPCEQVAVASVSSPNTKWDD